MKFYKFLSVFLATGISCLLVILILLLTTKRNNPGSLSEVIQWSEFDQQDAVHIAQLVSGTAACNQFMVLVKTILHHMGRFNTDRCGIKPMVIQTSTCSNPNKVLIFHLITNTEDQAYLQSKMIDWEVPNIAIHFYNIDKYMDLVRSVQSGHYSGSRSYIKLYLPEILPLNVEKVIMLDTDMLVNRHICDLWAHFDRFNGSQAFAMVLETSPYYWSETGQKYWPSLGRGYNAGLVLFHLARLRSMAWNSLWNESLHYLISNLGILPTAEQDVLNRIGHVQPQLPYTLPCAWNVQMGVLSLSTMCPVTWSMTSEAAQTAKALAIEELALIHFNAPQKPESAYPKRLRWVDDAHVYRPMSKKNLVARYLNVYHSFRDIPGRCFT